MDYKSAFQFFWLLPIVRHAFCFTNQYPTHITGTNISQTVLILVTFNVLVDFLFNSVRQWSGNFSVKVQMANILGFEGHMVSVATTKLYHCSSVHKYLCLQFPGLVHPPDEDAPSFLIQTTRYPTPNRKHSHYRHFIITQCLTHKPRSWVAPHELLHMWYFLFFYISSPGSMNEVVI